MREVHTGNTYGTTHGQTYSPEWNSWFSMRQRCQNPNHKGYKYWGGRGITICERWQTFENFLEDMGPRPDGTTIDRIDNDGNYEPDNCRWADALTQGKSKRPRPKGITNRQPPRPRKEH
jgi:hypothetical protein